MPSKRQQRRGKGLVNKLIDSLPFEAHIPGYSYAGPGTKLKERLARGDVPINGLDAAARDHDIAYSKTSDRKERNRADLVLADRAWERVKAKDSSLGERVAAYAVTNAMKLKAKLGMGCRRGKKRRTAIKKKKKVGAGLRKKRVTRKKRGTKKKRTGRKRARTVARIIPIPKTGGKLNSVLNRLGIDARSVGPTADRIRTVMANGRKAKSVRVGKGLYLRPYRSGYGLYLRPWAPDLN